MRSPLGAVLNRAERINFAPPGSGGRRGILGWGRGGKEAQLRAMSNSGTVFAITNRSSTAVASANWHLYRTAASGLKEDRVEVSKHAALDLWNKPNKFMSRARLVEAGQQHCELTGETSIFVGYHPQMPSVPFELWPVRPDRVAPVPDPDEFLAGYVYQSPSGDVVPLGLDQMLQILMPNPEDPYRGLGAVQAVMPDIKAGRYSAEWNMNFFLNGAEPGGIIKLAKRLGVTEFREFRERWNDGHKGVANAHRVAILTDGDWVDRKYTNRDMQFTELRTVSRDTILEAFGYPKSMLGIVEDVNRANAQSGEYVFSKWLTVPRLDRWKGMLNTGLLPLFGTTGKGLEFDYDSPVPEDEEAENAERESKATATKTYIDAGFEPAAVLAVVGVPDMPVRAVAPAPTPAAAVDVAATVREAVRAELAAANPRTAVASRSGCAHHVRNVDTADIPEPPDGVPAEDVEAVEAVDLAPVQEAFAAALLALLALWMASVVADWIDDLVDAVKAVITSGNLADLATLKVDTSDGASTLLDAMADLAEVSAGHVVVEAAAQDVTVEPVVPKRADLKPRADTTAALEGQRYAAAAGREAARMAGGDLTADEIGDYVRTHLDEMPESGARTPLAGALTGAQNTARAETFRSAPVGALYASEAMDSNTCLAPDAMVTTRRGEIRADMVTLADELLTHAGRWVAPSRIVVSEVDEALVVAKLSDGRRLRVTDDHPVLVVENRTLVWREAGDLTVGALMVGQASLDDGRKLVVPDLRFGQAPHDVAAINEVGSLPAVDVRAQRVPVTAVSLNDKAVANEEVHNPRADLRLGFVDEPGCFELKADSLLDGGLCAAGHVAPTRTVTSVLRQRRDDAEIGAASSAVDEHGRPTAGLATEGADLCLTVPEGGTTSPTRGRPSPRVGRAGNGAVVVPVAGRNGDREYQCAVRADLFDPIVTGANLGANFRVGELAHHGAVDGPVLAATGDLSSTPLAEGRRNGFAPAFPGAVAAATSCFLGDRCAAIDTRSVHDLSLVEVVAVQRERHVGQVFDFTVPGDETFWAEGVLVHNCSPCSEIHGRWIANTDDMATVWRLYPGSGYVNCLGGARCRGAVVGVWRPAQTKEGAA